jgi:hypothetical protein
VKLYCSCGLTTSAGFGLAQLLGRFALGWQPTPEAGVVSPMAIGRQRPSIPARQRRGLVREVETQFRGNGEDGSSPTGLSTVALEGGWESASAGQTAGQGSR